MDCSTSTEGGDITGSSLNSAHLAAIVESSDDGIVSKDLNGVIQTWNAGAERLFGYSAKEAIGRSMLLIVPVDRELEEEMILARIRRGERIEHFQTVRRHKDGSLIEVSVTISPLRDESGRIVGASNIARDVSDRLLVEAMHAQLAAIIDSSDDAIVSKNLDGIVQSWNKGAEQLFGYMAEEMIGQPILKLLPLDRQEEETRILERLRRGERVDHFETVRVCKDGRPVHVSVTISPIRDRSGRVIGASKVARDIGDRKLYEATATAFTRELEQRVKERTAELEEAHKEMEAFTYTIAHDLRNPLRRIVANSAMLLEDYGDQLPEEACRMLQSQSNSAISLAHLIEALLDYTKLGKADVSRSVVDVSALATALATELERPGVIFNIQPGMSANADASLMRLLLQNLMGNAAKFSPNGGEITVAQKGGVFYVQDQGIGFDMAYADKIFNVFEHLHADASGTGIGLANAKRIVEKHGGRIWASSVEGSDSTFYFTIPNPSIVT